MRVVLDTNIVISAQFWQGIPGQIYAAAASREYILLASEELIAEVARVLAYPKFARALTASGKTADALLNDFRAVVETVESVDIAADVVRDPKDNPIFW